MRRREKARKGERGKIKKGGDKRERERAKERDRERHLKQGYVYGGGWESSEWRFYQTFVFCLD